jgi:antitoxin VapB
MAFSIKNEDADGFARRLAATTGETLTEAVLVSLRERLVREEARRRSGAADRLRRLADEVANLPVLDARPADEILGYGETGMPA